MIRRVVRTGIVGLFPPLLMPGAPSAAPEQSIQPVGGENTVTSCDLLILVEQSTEPVAPLDGVRILRRRLGEWSEGSGLAEGAVRADGC